MERSRDWWVQAEADFAHAKASLELGHFDWACFAAQQAAEKGVKAALERQGKKASGHSIRYLLSALVEEVPPDLITSAKILDKHYLPTRYPNGVPEGAPTEVYTKEEAADALSCAETILRFCKRFLAG